MRLRKEKESETPIDDRFLPCVEPQGGIPARETRMILIPGEQNS